MTDAIELLRRVSQKLKLKRVLDLLDQHDPEAPQLEQGRRLAPTRPHPNLSPDPKVLRLACGWPGLRTGSGTPGRAGPGAERGPLGKTADPEARHPSPSPRAPDPRSISFRPGICFPAWPGSAERV